MAAKKETRVIQKSLFRIMRGMGRYNLGRVTERALESMVNFAHLAVIDCLDDSGTESGMTIGAIGRRVGVDPSRASRMVRSTVRAGYIERVISQEDARQTFVVLTAKGRKFAEGIHMIRHRYFATLLKGWPQKDCDDFARLLAQFARADRALREETKQTDKPSRETSAILRPILRLISAN